MKRFSEVLAVLRSIAWLLVPLYLVFVLPGQIGRVVRDETAATREMVDIQLNGMRSDVVAGTEAALRRVDAVIATANRTEVDATAQIAGARADILVIGKLADERLSSIQFDADKNLTAANGALGLVADSTAALERRYTGLPDEIRADREYQGLVAETMGVLGATKITMGQAAKTAKVIADEAPKMTAHVDEITADATREADALTKPQSFWGSLRAWLLTFARIYGAI